MKEMGTRLRPIVGTKAAGRPVRVSRASYYRSRRPVATQPKTRRRKPVRRLSEAKRAEIRARLNSERFMDGPPRQIGATRLDEGLYRCPGRTRYRILREKEEIRERRPQRVHPSYPKPERWAGAPNELGSGDITTLRGPTKEGLQTVGHLGCLQSLRSGLDAGHNRQPWRKSSLRPHVCVSW